MINGLKNITRAYQLYQVIRYGFLILVSICLARLFPDMELIDRYEKLTMIGGSLTFFWISGMFDGFLPVYRGADPIAARGLRAQVLRTSLVVSLISAAAVATVGFVAYPNSLLPQMVAWFALYTGLNAASQLYEYHLIATGQALWLLTYGSASYLLYFLAVIGPLWMGAGLLLSVQLLCALAGLRFVVMMVAFGRDISIPGDKALFRKYMVSVGPLIGASLLGGSAAYVDKYLVTSMFPGNEQAFVTFSYGARELPLVILLANALSVVKAGEIAAGIAENKMGTALEDLRQSARNLILWTLPVSVLLIAFSHPLFTAVFGQEFLPAALIFDIYLLLFIPRLLFPQTVLRALLSTHVLMISAALELVLNVGLSLLFLQVWGIPGIAAATVIAFLLDKGFQIVWLQRRKKISPQVYTDFSIWGFSALILVSAFALKYGVMGNWL